MEAPYQSLILKIILVKNKNKNDSEYPRFEIRFVGLGREEETTFSHASSMTNCFHRI
jgi:hypothetical protein